MSGRAEAPLSRILANPHRRQTAADRRHRDRWRRLRRPARAIRRQRRGQAARRRQCETGQELLLRPRFHALARPGRAACRRDQLPHQCRRGLRYRDAGPGYRRQAVLYRLRHSEERGRLPPLDLGGGDNQHCAGLRPVRPHHGLRQNQHAAGRRRLPNGARQGNDHDRPHRMALERRPSRLQKADAMKLASLETGIVLLPNDEPLAGFSENPNAKNPIVWLKLRTDNGIEGLGVTYFGGALTRTLRHAVDELGALVIGEDPLRVEAVAAKLRAAAVSAGPAGIFLMAMSAIDVALWDIKGKALGLPLWKLLGGGRDRIATYASGALRRGLKLEEAVTAAGRLREKGYRQTKMQLGLPGPTSPAREVEQARLIREAVGPDMDLMCDINQRWRPEQAVDIGRRVEDAGVGLFWLEDVTTHDDYPGLARVAAALSTPVAGGEYLYGITPFRHMLEARSVDIVMIDQVRSGGITSWLKIAGMAEAFNIPVVSHGVPEIHVHLVGAVPNGLTVEYMPRLFPLWRAVPQPKDGMLEMPTASGLGLEFDGASIEKYRA
ncbi:MAG: mandelate racemase/muconate lactonizing enzyme family protein [Alphaproteobacteria bacterium]|nr:MAG: mandelate racemase/muconate lactonizing enzyme family protein [Alphaproteobacteria bacterium]